MADGAPTRTINVTLPQAMADRLDEAAQGSGMDMDRYLGELIADSLGMGQSELQDSRAYAFQEAAARKALEDYDRTGEWVSPDDAFSAVTRAREAHQRR